MNSYASQDDPSFGVGQSIMSQSSQMYGDFGDESPHHYSSYYQDGDFGGGQDDGMDGTNDNGDPKRRRIARACDMCRKKKIKCDGKMPSCSHCINYKTECIFTQVEKKRNPPKGPKYIEGLENRLGRMESLLKLSGLLGEDNASTDLGALEKRLADQAQQAKKQDQLARKKSEAGDDSSTPTKSPETSDSVMENGTTESSVESPVGSEKVASMSGSNSQSRKKEEVEVLSDLMCSLVTTNQGETRYIGSSSGFSIFSPKGIQWVNDKAGDVSFQHMMSDRGDDDKSWTYWKPEIFGDIFTRKIYRPLPPLSETLSLLKDYFENFNCMFPLFHEPTFMHLVRRQYSRDPYTGSGWWASLNCALAIAHRLRVMSNLVPQDEDQKAWGHLKNALGVMSELTMRNTDLLSVQALLGMALFLQGTPNPQPSFLLVASALRLAHSIGLHKRGSGFNLSAAEVEQRKRVFWIAYMLDKDVCLRSGRPPAQDDDDMNVELPSDDPPDNIGNIPLANGKDKVNIFRLMCTFAIIESKVYNQLYSVKAAKQSDGELLNTIGELDMELEEWKESIPIDFRPEHEIKATHTPLMLHVVVLHFAYYNCLTTIHRMSVHHGYWTSRLSDFAIQGLNARPLNPRVFSSAALCVQAARASIQLIRYIPQGDYSCVWMIIYYPVSALVTIFANVLQNPQDARVRADIRLMHQVVSFLSILAVDEETGGVKRMLEVCQEFERIAKLVLEKSDKELHPGRRKRKNAAKEDEEHLPRAAPERQTPLSTHTPQTGATPAPSTGLTPDAYTNGDTSSVNGGMNNPAAVSLPPSHSPSMGGVVGGVSNPAFSSPLSQPVAGGIPVDQLDMMPSFVPQPGDFPNPFGDAADMLQLGIGSPQMAMAMSGFPQGFGSQDVWNVPMNFEWDWTAGMPPGEQHTGAPQGQGPDGQFSGAGPQEQLRQ